MVNIEYIDIDVEEVPYRFEIELAGGIFGIELHYNHTYDFFTMNIDRNDEMLIVGEKLIIGKPLFSYSTDPRLPSVTITPVDLSGKARKVGWDELGTTVFLMIDPTGVDR